MTETAKQAQQIYDYMRSEGPITQMIALARFGCMRLPSRVWDLRQAGVDVRSEFEYKLDANGKVVKKWKRYFLA